MDSCMNKSLSESNLTVETQKDTVSPSTFVSTRNKRKRGNEDFSTEFAAFKEEMKHLIISLTAKNGEELTKIGPTLADIQQSNRNIENSIAFLTSQNEEYKKKIEKLENQAQEDRKYITILEDKIEDLHKGMKKTSFEVKNVPKKENETKEDLIGMITCLSKNISCDLNRSDIKDIYRVRKRKEGPQNTPIIVETTSTLIKNDFFKMSKAFNIKHKSKITTKHLGFRTATDTPVFISENLTAKSSRLYFLGRELVKSKCYKFCWSAYGKVYIRKDENSPIILIKNELQAQKLLQGD
ncbi:uncharacterized protein [Epargyreus clarus]|uniref:uncharacterized protein n=1 Tax=Epargyreus clarus TaxID=520877 RepID=UPI003C30C33F